MTTLLSGMDWLTFDDVLILPQFSTIKSRKDVDLSSAGLELPIISANMDSVTGADMAIAMIRAGGNGVLHRFWSIEDNEQAAQKVLGETGKWPWVSVGISEAEMERVEALMKFTDHIVIDVAHGASMEVVKAYQRIKDILPNHNVVVGNFANNQSLYDFRYHLGYIPDMVKINIGAGSSCLTRVQTGVGVPQLSALMKCACAGIPMIADGAMRVGADYAKALAVKNVVALMTGGPLAGCDESPGVTKKEWQHDILGMPIGLGEKFKIFRGSASKESYEAQGKTQTYIAPEGDSFKVPYRGPVADVLAEIAGGLRSAFSYVGAQNVSEFQKKVEFIQITNAGHVESGAHGKNRI